MFQVLPFFWSPVYIQQHTLILRIGVTIVGNCVRQSYPSLRSLALSIFKTELTFPVPAIPLLFHLRNTSINSGTYSRNVGSGSSHFPHLGAPNPHPPPTSHHSIGKFSSYWQLTIFHTHLCFSSSSWLLKYKPRLFFSWNTATLS